MKAQISVTRLAERLIHFGQDVELAQVRLDTLLGRDNHRWAEEYEFELRAQQRLKFILPIVFLVIFLLLYLVFNSAAEAAVLIFPTLYAFASTTTTATGLIIFVCVVSTPKPASRSQASICIPFRTASSSFAPG